MAILKAGHETSGVIYMAGYIIECSLKAYLKALNRKVPFEHEIRKLWKKSGLRFTDLPQDVSGKIHYFFSFWRVDLRYEVGFKCEYNPEELITAAKWLSSIIQTRARRSRRR